MEDPGTGGDVSRYIPPGRVGTDSLFFEAFNRGKRSIALDLKSTAGRAVFERLVATARRGVQQPAWRPAGAPGADLRRPGQGQRGDRVRRPDRLRPHRCRRAAARLRRAHPGGVRVGVPDRRAGWSADQERPLAGRLHRRPHRRPRAHGGALRREADGAGPGRGHEPVRLGARDAELPGHLVPLERVRDRAPVDVGPSERRARSSSSRPPTAISRSPHPRRSSSG